MEAILWMKAQYVVPLMSTKVSSAAMELYDQNILKSKVFKCIGLLEMLLIYIYVHYYVEPDQ